ncbi:hypothetical protein DAI21_22445 (plasmid) [Lelliottia sp. WB101]|nr:hypothetical protein DAI21_22445 [Lelliottia sp. WB101]
MRFYRSCGEGGLTGTVGASRGVGVASGIKPEGQRQPGWLCAKHDSPPGRPTKHSLHACR